MGDAKKKGNVFSSEGMHINALCSLSLASHDVF